MADAPLRVLLVDDDEDDYLLTRDHLNDIAGGFALDWVSQFDVALADMRRNAHDAYLLDFRLGSRNGLDLLRAGLAAGCTAPVIILTGEGQREIDVEAMRSGAADFLIKGNLDGALLERTIRYALLQRRHEDALRRSHDELERRVTERTAELARANVELQAQVAERRRAEQALKEADRRKDEFLAMLGHELRNPLAPIRNALYIMQVAHDDEPTVAEARQLMERQVQHLVRLVDDLLDVSRITRGKIKLQREQIELSQILAVAIESSRPLLDARRHQLQVSLPSEPLSINGDATRLAQVFLNLLNNAAKYTPNGRKVWLSVERNGSTAVVRVRDEGMGISTEMLPHIFELFTQVDRTLDRADGGLGIGLTLVRRLVELHGGEVQAESPGAGQGSTFTVLLPLAEMPPARGGQADNANNVVHSPNCGGHRVLVVDDNQDSARTMSKLLVLSGFEVRTVYDGFEAMNVVEDFSPRTVLLDIGLPGMNGYEVAQALRARDGDGTLRLYALTGYGSDEDRRRATIAGFDGLLVKPVLFDTLLKLLGQGG